MRRQSELLFLGALLLLPTARAGSYARTPSLIENQCEEILAPEQTAALTPDDVLAFAKANGATSVDDLFLKMKRDARWKRFFETYVFMHHSLSAEHEAVDTDYPRRILFDRGLVMGSTAHPAHPEQNRKIAMFYVDPVKGWRTALLTVDKSGLKLKRDPASCTQCHGSPPRPNWAAYRLWPGAYVTQYHFFNGVGAAWDSAHPVKPPTVRERVTRMFARKRESSEPERRKVPASYRMFAYDGTGGGRESGQLLNEFFNRWNFTLIVKQLRSSPSYDRLKYALVGSLLECDDVPSFLGPPQASFRAEHEKTLGKSYAELLSEVRRMTELRRNEKIAAATRLGEPRAAESYRQYSTASKHDGVRMADLRYLFEPDGIDVSHFSLDYTPGEDSSGYEFDEVDRPDFGLRRLLCHFLPEVMRSDKEHLWPLGSVDPLFAGNGGKDSKTTACRLLKQKSLEAIAGGGAVARPSLMPTRASVGTH